MRMRTIILFAIVCSAVATRAGAQAPVRDAVRPPAGGTGTVAGQIVSTDVPARSIRRAIVTLKGQTIERGVVTTDDGRFEFGGLPRERYFLTVAKAPYVTTSFGATRIGGPGAPIALEAGQRLDVSIVLPLGAVLEGRVTGVAGEPIAGASVSARAVQGGAPVRTIVKSALTDDRGVYRLFGLLPGTYVVSSSMATTSIYTAGRPSASDVDALLAGLLARTSTRSIAPPPNVASLYEPDGPVTRVAPVYYPGVSSVDDAASVTVLAGEERSGLDFPFVPSRTVTIEGTVSGPIRNPSAIQLSLQAAGTLASSVGTGSAQANPDGSFAFRHVPPAHYTVTARVSRRQADDISPSTPARPGMQVTTLTTPADEAARVALALQPGSTVSGRVTFESAAGTIPVMDLPQIQVRILPQQISGPSMILSGSFTMQRNGAIRQDRAFTVTSIAPGTYAVEVMLPPVFRDKWWARAAMFDGRDLLDGTSAFTPGVDLTDVVITLSEQRTSVAGMLRSASGPVGPEYALVAFSTDSRWWSATSRRTHITRPATDGAFEIRDLPPGDYFFAVVTDINANELTSPMFFERLTPAAIRVSIREGAQRQDVTIQ